MPLAGRCVGGAICIAVTFVLAHMLARSSLLLSRTPSCAQVTVYVISCENAPRRRRANAKRLLAHSPFPAQLVPCTNRTPAAAQFSGISGIEARLMSSHVRSLSVWLRDREVTTKATATATAASVGGAASGEECLLVLEDDAVVNWPAVKRILREMDRLRDAWDIVSLFDDAGDKYDSPRGRLFYTDAAVRFGCLHRILAGKQYTAGLIYSGAAVRAVLARASSQQWRYPYDIWLGQMNGSPFRRPAHPLRILRSGCKPAALLHGRLPSTLAWERDAFQLARVNASTGSDLRQSAHLQERRL